MKLPNCKGDLARKLVQKQKKKEPIWQCGK
jgi:hypothetical protein